MIKPKEIKSLLTHLRAVFEFSLFYLIRGFVWFLFVWSVVFWVCFVWGFFKRKKKKSTSQYNFKPPN